MKSKKQGATKKPGKRTIRAPQRAREPKAVWYERFIRLYAKTGNITLSCRAARIGRQTYYDHLASNPEFQTAVDAAKEEAIDELEAVARERGVASSDTLLIFLLKSLRPDLYRETVRTQHSGAVTIDVSKLSDEELRALAQS